MIRSNAKDGNAGQTINPVVLTSRLESPRYLNDRIKEMQVDDLSTKYNTLKEGLERPLLAHREGGNSLTYDNIQKLLERL